MEEEKQKKWRHGVGKMGKMKRKERKKRKKMKEEDYYKMYTWTCNLFRAKMQIRVVR